MKAVSTLFPVLFMIGLGFISRIRGFVTSEQKEGANHIIFNILFPILIFNILFSSKIEVSSIYIVTYVFVVFVLAMVVGKLTGKFTSERFSKISFFLLSTCEGGNVALPLYLSIVGASSNTVIFDLAGVLIAFVVMPFIVEKYSESSISIAELMKKIFTNTFVIAVILGLGLNIVGVYNWLSNTEYINIYTNTISTATAPIVGIILFIIGYDLKIHIETIGPLLKLLVIRIVFYLVVIGGFFILFPDLMADKIYVMGVLIYFMSPTGFATPMQITPLYENEEDASFTSAFISLGMIVTLLVYAGVVIGMT